MNTKAFLAVAAATLGTFLNAAPGEMRIYTGLELGYDTATMRSGGHNTVGPHDNTGRSDDLTRQLGVKVGADFGAWKTDLAIKGYKAFDFKTNSYPGYTYKSEVALKTLVASGYYKFYRNDKVEIYAGAGLGLADIDVDTDDTVVEGSGSKKKLLWQAELGFDYLVGNDMVINWGVRRVDFGKTEIDLHTKDTGAPAGNFTADMSSVDWFLGFVYTF